MGNFVRGVRELPKLRRQLEEVTAKRIQAERNLKVLKDDLERKGQALEKQRLDALTGSATAVSNLKQQMDSELKAIQDENEHLEKILQRRAVPDEKQEDDSKPGSTGRRRRRFGSSS
jgi:hypothetical protein